jgi:hypothetical protein
MTGDPVEDLRARRLAEALAVESQPDAGRHLWWLSFVDDTLAAAVPEDEQKPGGPGFLGVCIVEAATPIGAVAVASGLGINPGGEIQIAGPAPMSMWAKEWRHRLLSAAEIQKIPGEEPR